MTTYNIIVSFCLSLAGQPTECVEVYTVRTPLDKIAVFTSLPDCEVAAIDHGVYISNALRFVHQPKTARFRGKCEEASQ
jgi:hypothetical protein